MVYTLILDPDAPVTKIQQIVNGIQYNLKNGNLAFSEKLPSINDFSKSLRVARDTLEKAYNVLKSHGSVVSIPGKGIYTANSHSLLRKY